jgi:asparagine synthase (glutamine-hydrolysing)
MCGFAGYFDLRDRHRVETDTIHRMTEELLHRGPDSAGFLVEGNVALGFRRLSIVDLATGDQPIFNEDRSLALLCTGEIYNHPALRRELEGRGHVFATHSDVEVVLHLYEELGRDLVDRLSGQFAFVVYDRRKQELFLARDHFGVTPLYHAEADGLFLFASEIKALLRHPAVPREVDLTGLDQVLTFPGVVSPRTLFRGISSLPCGHRICVRGARVEVSEYWDLDYPRQGELAHDRDARPEESYRERLRELLERSVRARLQADVPVGVYLSGGLDSSLVAALAGRFGGDACRHAFSIRFTDPSLCESRYQRLMADRLGMVHHQILFDWSEIADRLSDMVYHCECPVRETFNTCSMALSEAARKEEIKVILGGEGADELFAGYPGYRFDQLGTRRQARYDADSLLEQELRERLWGDPDLFYESDFHALREIKNALYSDAVNEMFDDFECVNFPVVRKDRLEGRHPVHQRSYLDFRLRLADHLLSEHGDRMTLANSVEGRYPFLDVDLVDFARQIPPDLKIHGFTEKYLIKRMALDLVPRDIIEREKFGFRAPGTPFLLRQGIEWINDLLAPERIARQGYFNPGTVETLRRRYLRDGFDFNTHLEIDLLMVVITFGLLCDRFGLPPL